MGFEPTELTAAVTPLVRGTLRYERGALSSIDRSLVHRDVVETVSSVLLYEPDAIFYVIRLGLNRFRLTVSSEISVLDQMLSVVDDLAVSARPIVRVEGLREAAAALLRMDSALARSGSVSGSEYRRYTRATDRALRDLAEAVRQSYVPRGSSETVTDVVRPREEARGIVRTLLRLLQSTHALVLAGLPTITGSLEAFLASDLVRSVAGNQIARARQELETIRGDLESLDPSERRLIARSSALGVLANRSVLRGVADRRVPGQPRLHQGISATPEYRVRAYGPGLAPSLLGGLSAPYKLVETVTDSLGINDLNGVGPFDVLLVGGGALSDVPGVARAETMGRKKEPFAVGGDLALPHPIITANGPFNIFAGASGEILHLLIDGDVREVVLTNGAAVAAATVANDINVAAAGWTPASPILATAVGNRVSISYQNGANTPFYRDRHIQVCTGFDYATALGPWTVNGSTPETRTRGWDANNELWIQPNDRPTPVIVTLTPGAWPSYQVTAAGVAADVTGAMVAAGESLQGDVASGQIVLRSLLWGEGSVVTVRSEGVRVAPDPRAGLAKPSLLALPTLGFSDGDDVREKDVSFSVVAQRLNSDATFAAGALASRVADRYLDALQAYRVGAVPFDAIRVPLAEDPTTDWPAYTELKVAVTGGDNGGTYGLSAAPTHAAGLLELPLDRRLRDATVGLTFHVLVYRERLHLVSKDAGLTGVIDLYDPATSARALLGLSDAVIRSTSASVIVERDDPVHGWAPMDLTPIRVGVDDSLMNGVRVEQARISSIATAGSGVLGVTPYLSSQFTLSTTGFSIEAAWALAFAQLVAALELWQRDTLPPYTELTDLDRALARVLLAETGRDAVDVIHARLTQLKARLVALRAVVDTYDGRRVGQVDSAVNLLTEHGYDRAADLLLDLRVQDLLHASARTSSYAGAAQDAISALVTNDLNESTSIDGSSIPGGARLVASILSDEDPLYSRMDMEDEAALEVVDYYRAREP